MTGSGTSDLGALHRHPYTTALLVLIFLASVSVGIYFIVKNTRGDSNTGGPSPTDTEPPSGTPPSGTPPSETPPSGTPPSETPPSETPPDGTPPSPSEPTDPSPNSDNSNNSNGRAAFTRWMNDNFMWLIIGVFSVMVAVLLFSIWYAGTRRRGRQVRRSWDSLILSPSDKEAIDSVSKVDAIELRGDLLGSVFSLPNQNQNKKNKKKALLKGLRGEEKELRKEYRRLPGHDMARKKWLESLGKVRLAEAYIFGDRDQKQSVWDFIEDKPPDDYTPDRSSLPSSFLFGGDK